MPFFNTSDTLYAAMQELFERMRISSSNPIDDLSASRLIIKIRLSSPTAEITVNGRQQPVQVSYGSSVIRPDLDVSMQADVLHQILLHETSLRSAIADQKMKVIGPIWKTKSLASILNEGRALYPQVLQEQGLR